MASHSEASPAGADLPSPAVITLLSALMAGRPRGGPTPAPGVQLETSIEIVHRACELGLVTRTGDSLEVTRKGLNAIRRARTLKTVERGAVVERSSLPDRPAIEHVQPAAAPVPVATSSPLGWLRRRTDRNGRPLITSEQHAAGERLSADLWRARLTPRITASWTGIPGAVRRTSPVGHGLHVGDAVIAAKMRVERALRAVGLEFSGLLMDVCGDLKGLEEFERANGWPQRSGKVVLQIALDRLARHYGILPPESAEADYSARIRRWAEDEARPSIDGWMKR